MFIYHAHLFRGFNLAINELSKRKKELDDKTQMKYLVLHLYIYLFSMLACSPFLDFFTESIETRFNVILGIVLFYLPYGIATFVTHDYNLFTRSLMYPYNAVVKGAVESDLNDIERTIKRGVDRNCGLGIHEEFKSKIPTHSFVTSSHYDKVILEEYLEENFKRSNIKVSMKSYIRSLRDQEVSLRSESQEVRVTKTEV